MATWNSWNATARWLRLPRRERLPRAEQGRVVFVTGEPGIGKTSLVTRFVRDLEPGARVLFGTCDDLSIPRPLGPLRDLVGTVSPPLEEALAAGIASHELQSLLIAELELPPRPTVLVLEDVHWADDATLDAITVLGRRIGSLPALMVLTFRSGEAAHPLRAARRRDPRGGLALPRAGSAVGGRGLLAGGRRRRHACTRRRGGNPFYVTELLASPRDASELPPSITNAVLGRASRLDEPERARLVELVSVVPSRASTAVLDAVMPDWTEAAEEPERQGLLQVEPSFVRFRHELARNAIRSSIPAAARRRLHGEILEALLAADADPADVVHHAEAAGAEDVVAEYALVAARRAAALESNREAYSHYHRAADFVDRLPPAEQATCSRSWPPRPTPSAGSRRRSGDGARDRGLRRARRPRGGRALHARRLALLLVRRQRRRGAAQGVRGGRDPRAARRVGRAGRTRTAASRSWRCSPTRPTTRWAGASARSSSRRGSATTTSACTR